MLIDAVRRFDYNKMVFKKVKKEEKAEEEIEEIEEPTNEEKTKVDSQGQESNMIPVPVFVTQQDINRLVYENNEMLKHILTLIDSEVAKEESK